MTLTDALASMLACTVTLLVVVPTAAVLARREPQPRSLETMAPALALVAAVSMALTALLGGGPTFAAVTAVLLAGSALALAPLVPGWTATGVVGVALTADMLLVQLGLLVSTLAGAGPGALLGPVGTVLSAIGVLGLEVLLAVGLLVESGLRSVRRGAEDSPPATGPAAYRPWVSLHLVLDRGLARRASTAVEGTLASVATLGHERLEVVLVHPGDAATTAQAEALRARYPFVRPVASSGRPGGRGTALNDALRSTDTRAEVIGVLSPGHRVRPDHLARCLPHLADTGVTVVRSPVAPHEGGQLSTTDGPDAGTCRLLLSRRAVEAIGGWDEWCADEQAELVVRMLAAGGRSVRLQEPAAEEPAASFEELRRRWLRASGGAVQVLRLHWRSLVPWDVSPDNRLTPHARWELLSSATRWWRDGAALAVTGLSSLVALQVSLAGVPGPGIGTGTGSPVPPAAPTVLAALAFLTVVGVLWTRPETRSGGLGALTRRVALTWAGATGALRGAVALGPFAPDGGSGADRPDRRTVPRGTIVETLAAGAVLLLGVAAIRTGTPTGVMAGGLLLGHASMLSLAPVHAWSTLWSGEGSTAASRGRVPVRTRLALPVRRGAAWPVLGAGALALAVVATAPGGTLGDVLRPRTSAAAAELPGGAGFAVPQGSSPVPAPAAQAPAVTLSAVARSSRTGTTDVSQRSTQGVPVPVRATGGAATSKGSAGKSGSGASKPQSKPQSTPTKTASPPKSDGKGHAPKAGKGPGRTSGGGAGKGGGPGRSKGGKGGKG